ncbi:hypothetical protein YPPY04_2239, partial [Yersinia pestis PY-04]
MQHQQNGMPGQFT